MTAGPRNVLKAWRSVPGLVRGAVEGRTDEEIDLRPQPTTMTLRETVHHLAEAQVVAASIVAAALGAPGCTYDWSWMWPSGEWMQRLRYDQKPIGPALELITALNAWIVAQVEPLGDGLQRAVQLRDEAGKEPRTTTVAEVLLQEVEHAREHLAEAGPRGRRNR